MSDGDRVRQRGARLEWRAGDSGEWVPITRAAARQRWPTGHPVWSTVERPQRYGGGGFSAADQRARGQTQISLWLDAATVAALERLAVAWQTSRRQAVIRALQEAARRLFVGDDDDGC